MSWNHQLESYSQLQMDFCFFIWNVCLFHSVFVKIHDMKVQYRTSFPIFESLRILLIIFPIEHPSCIINHFISIWKGLKKKTKPLYSHRLSPDRIDEADLSIEVVTSKPWFPISAQIIDSLCFGQKGRDTVDGSEFRLSPVEVGSLSHYLQGLGYPRWCRISSINNRVFGWWFQVYFF